MSTLHLTLSSGPRDGATIAALKLADAAVARGHRVTVFAYGDGVQVAANGAPTAALAQDLLHTGVHGGTVSWVADEQALGEAGRVNAGPGVVAGHGGDLWRFVRDAAVALGVTGRW